MLLVQARVLARFVAQVRLTALLELFLCILDVRNQFRCAFLSASHGSQTTDNGNHPRTLSLTALYPKRNLSLVNQTHKVYPYSLREFVIDRPNQVWRT